MQVEKFLAEKNLSAKVKAKKVNEKNDGVSIGIIHKKTAAAKDGMKVGLYSACSAFAHVQECLK